MIKIKNLHKNYNSKILFNNINFKIERGERIAIVAPNGNGKTTLVNIITGITPPTSGEVEVSDDVVFGIQFQDEYPFSSVSAYNLSKLILDANGITMNVRKLESDLDFLKMKDLFFRRMGSMSGGEKQKMNIFLAFLNNPNVLILDELGAGLDVHSRDNIYEFLEIFLKNTNCSLIMISHDMTEISRFCHKLYLIRNQKLHMYLIDDLIKQYGSVQKFISQEFSDYYNEMREMQAITKINYPNKRFQKLYDKYDKEK